VPAGSRLLQLLKGSGKAMRIVGLDIHRVFAEAVMLDNGKVIKLGRVGMTREHLVS
jgi:hypothetical protein